MMSPAFSSQDDPLPFVFVPGRETLRPGCALRPLPFPHFVSPAERKRSFRIHSFSADGEKCKSSDTQRVRRIKKSWCQSKPREKPPSPCRRWGTLGRRKLSRRCRMDRENGRGKQIALPAPRRSRMPPLCPAPGPAAASGREDGGGAPSPRKANRSSPAGGRKQDRYAVQEEARSGAPRRPQQTGIFR